MVSASLCHGGALRGGIEVLEGDEPGHHRQSDVGEVVLGEFHLAEGLNREVVVGEEAGDGQALGPGLALAVVEAQTEEIALTLRQGDDDGLQTSLAGVYVCTLALDKILFH